MVDPPALADLRFRPETRMHPFFGPIGPNFLLPDGHHFFQGVDEPAASVERLIAVGATDGDHHADLPQAESARPGAPKRRRGSASVAEPRPRVRPVFLRAISRIGLVVERGGLTIAASSPEPCPGRSRPHARLIGTHSLGQRGVVDGGFGNLDHGMGLSVSRTTVRDGSSMIYNREPAGERGASAPCLLTHRFTPLPSQRAWLSLAISWQRIITRRVVPRPLDAAGTSSQRQGLRPRSPSGRRANGKTIHRGYGRATPRPFVEEGSERCLRGFRRSPTFAPKALSWA